MLLGVLDQTLERRRRATKGIVVVVDRDSDASDRLARELEADGYHTPTAEQPRYAAQLIRIRRADAVIENSRVVFVDASANEVALRAVVDRLLDDPAPAGAVE